MLKKFYNVINMYNAASSGIWVELCSGIVNNVYRGIHKNVSSRKSLIARVVEIGAVWTDQHYKVNEMGHPPCENQSHRHPTDVATQRRNLTTKKCVHITDQGHLI